MTIHKEGFVSIAIATVFFSLLNLAVFWYFSAAYLWLCIAIFAFSFLVLLFIISFFRIPSTVKNLDEKFVLSPCDGKVVVIEETTDHEYFNGKVLQVSIFMSPANVHVNLNPISGKCIYNQYHKGKYLVAWNPKSSTENERHSVVLDNGSKQILVKQIAGAVAKRIVNYLKVGQEVQQGQELGFIKFGSRVDLLLPVGTKINAKLNDKVTAGVSVIASLS